MTSPSSSGPRNGSPQNPGHNPGRGPSPASPTAALLLALREAQKNYDEAKEALRTAQERRIALIPTRKVLWKPQSVVDVRRTRDDTHYQAARDHITRRMIESPHHVKLLAEFGANKADITGPAEGLMNVPRVLRLTTHHKLPIWGGGRHFTGDAALDTSRYGHVGDNNLVRVHHLVHEAIHLKIDQALCAAYGIKNITEMNREGIVRAPKEIEIPWPSRDLELNPKAERALMRLDARLQAVRDAQKKAQQAYTEAVQRLQAERAAAHAANQNQPQKPKQPQQQPKTPKSPAP